MGGITMKLLRQIAMGASAVLAATAVLAAPAFAQKQGGTLRIYNTTQPPSASIHEESTIATNMPFMALKLGAPSSVEAESETPNPETCQAWAKIMADETLKPEGEMPFVLLGNSYLTRFQMARTNDQLVLERRY